MNTQQLERVIGYYSSQGLNINSKTIENCLSSTAEVYSLSSKEVYSVISPYFYENTKDAISTITSTTTHNIEESKHVSNVHKSLIDSLTYSSDDFTDMTENYDVNTDDQTKNIVKFADQEYLSIDFTKKVVFRFPIFDESSYIPHVFGKQKYYQVQKYIREQLPKLKDINWTNQTLSYARSNIVGKHIIECIIYPLYRKGLFGREGNAIGTTTQRVERAALSPLKVVDATGNIGADSILFAMERYVSSVKVYEILPNVYDMLVNNIHLYGMNKKIQALNKRFDYDVPKNALVMIDPPYEADNNRGNFNLSIDSMPIYYVAQKILDAGAACVILSMPRTYKYNTKFAIDHNQHVSVYQMGKINNKMFLICRLSDAERIGLINFNYTLVTTDETQKMWNGKVNAYKCKSESKYSNSVNSNIEKVQASQWRLVLPRDKYNKDKEGNIVLPKEVKDIIKDVNNL
jgi:hypothetical protein